jgi:uncharacterized protein YndB with AHSA1/START domain
MPSLTGSFTIPLDLTAAPERVWRLFAELPLRKKWVRMPGPSSTSTHEFDFRIGGSERLTNTFTSGEVSEELENRSTFYDIVPNQRILFGYEAVVSDILRWVALVTVDLASNDDGGTHLEWTEQYSFVHLSTSGGVDDVKHLIGGTRLRLNGLVAAVAELEPVDETAVD